MKEKKLRELLDRYYEGNTTPEEEKELRDYFLGAGIFRGYEAEKGIFSYYSRLENIPIPSEDFEKRIINTLSEFEINKSKKAIRVRYISILSTAAALLILAGSWFFLLRQKEPADSFSDPKIAYAETMKILNDISVRLNKGTMALQPISKLNTAARASIKSLDRSVSVMEDGLRRIGFEGKDKNGEN